MPLKSRGRTCILVPVNRIHFNACSNVLVMGSNHQIECSCFLFPSPILSNEVVQDKKCSTFHVLALPPCTRALLNFSVSLNFSICTAEASSIGLAKIERLTGNHFNAYSSVLVLGSNPQISFHIFRFFPPILSNEVMRVKKMWNFSRFCVASLRKGHITLLCIVQF